MAKAFTTNEALELSNWHRENLNKLSAVIEAGTSREEQAVQQAYAILERRNYFETAFRNLVMEGNNPLDDKLHLLPLIEAIYVYRKTNEQIATCRGLVSTSSNSISQLRKDLEPSFSQITWAFTIGRKKQSAENAFKTLTELKTSSFAEQSEKVLDEYNQRHSVAHKAAWPAFMANPTSFKNSFVYCCGLSNSDEAIPQIAKTLIARKDQIDRRIKVVQTAVKTAADNVKKASNEAIEAEIKRTMSKVPIEDLRIWKSSMRTGPLTEAGYKTFSDLLGVSQYRLSDLRGIGDSTAKTITKAVSSLEAEIRKNAKLSLSIKNPTADQTQLLISLCDLSDLKKLSEFADKTKKALPESFEKNFAVIHKPRNLRFLIFEPKATREANIRAFGEVNNVLNGKYGEIVDKLFEEALKITDCSDKKTKAPRAYGKFAEDPNHFIGLLKKNAPGVYGETVLQIDEIISGLVKHEKEEKVEAELLEKQRKKFSFSAAGTYYHKGASAWPSANKNSVSLQREPGNRFDSNAIAIYVDYSLAGYVPRETAAKMAPLMDSEYKVVITEASGYSEPMRRRRKMRGGYYYEIDDDKIDYGGFVEVELWNPNGIRKQSKTSNVSKKASGEESLREKKRVKDRTRMLDLTTYRSFERPEEYIHFNDLIVRSSIKTCGNSKHSIHEVIAIVCVFTPKRGVIEVAADAFCCPQCKKYFMLEKTFDKIAARGSICCRIITKPGHVKEFIPRKYKELSEQSFFNQLGYNVNMQENLTAEERRTILDFAIENGFKSQKDTISFLQWLIDFNGSRKNMSNSVSKWRSDIKYLVSSRTTDVKRVRIDRIFLTEHKW